MKPTTHLPTLLLLFTSTLVSALPQAKDFSIAPEPTTKPLPVPTPIPLPLPYEIQCSTNAGGSIASSSEARIAAQALCYDSVHDRPDPNPKRPGCTIMNSYGSAAVAVCAKDATRMKYEDIIPIMLEIIWKCEDPWYPWKVRGLAAFTWGTFNVYGNA